jgi:predicted short-subunit dehydrogenase-like oxidoreductase (DUF2520 family)
MFSTIRVVGRGRLGSAVAARLLERGHRLDDGDPGLVLLCVPDSVIAEVAGSIPPGPWLAHMSGATPLRALEPHSARFGVHPLQTFVPGRGAEQLDGAWAGISGEDEAALGRARWLATRLGLHPFEVADDTRALYHAGAALASNYLVTLHRAAARAFVAAGAPPEALLPLMRRTMENGFELTGPLARGDWTTVGAHLAAIHEHLPDLEPLYRALADATVP